ncbi:MAG: CRISPR-associated endonuclease Cas3'' [Metallosphaera sp.]|uniref:CRISPR-associated endonuclease Cas3'' n=2 Tax=Metallosphaera sp. TaxID=2020860 RepID=UPI003164520F
MRGVNSMKPCAFVNQTLRDHSLGSLSNVDAVFKDGYFKTVKRRMDRFMQHSLKSGRVEEADVRTIQGMSWERWRDLIRFLTAIHDIGKADDYYQKKFNDSCEASKSSFRLHEVSGALVLFNAKWNSNLVKLWSILAILNHLNAIRTVSNLKGYEGEIKPEMLKLKNYGSVLVSDPQISSLIRKVTGVVDNVSPVDYNKSNFQEMKHWVEFMATKPLAKPYILLLFPIIIGDNLDSSQNRSKDETSRNKSRFIQSLQNMKVIVVDH